VKIPSEVCVQNIRKLSAGKGRYSISSAVSTVYVQSHYASFYTAVQ